MTDGYLAVYQNGWNLWGPEAFRAQPEGRLRLIVQLPGDREEFRAEVGVPCDSAARCIYARS